MDAISLFPWAVFGGITCGAYAIFSAFGGKDNRAAERLDLLRGTKDRQRSQSQGMAAVLEKAAPTLSKALQPQTELEQNALRVRLSNAGFHQGSAPSVYLAIKTLMLALGCFLGGGYGLFNYGFTQSGLVTLVAAAGVGFYIPELALMYLISKRKQDIFLSLPDVLDLLVVCTESGLGLDAGMKKVSDELKDTHIAICAEIHMCLMQMQMGRARREVLHDLGVRTGVDDVRSLVGIIVQADRFGTPISQTLRVQSDAMRIKRRQNAEEKAQKTAVQMLFPLVLFIFPGIFVVLVGPAAIKMMTEMLNQ